MEELKYKKTKRNKPLYKKILRLRQNVEKRSKIIKFKKEKWRFLRNIIERIVKKKKIRKNKKKRTRDIRYRYFEMKKYVLVPKYRKRYKQKFLYTLHLKKKFKLVFGDFIEKKIKSIIKKVRNKHQTCKIRYNKNQLFLEEFESHISRVLCRSYFSNSIQEAKQLITHGHIKVNNKIIKIPNYGLKKGDLISFTKKGEQLAIKQLMKVHLSQVKPIPPKYLNINYSTFQILFNGDVKNQNLSANYSIRWDIPALLHEYARTSLIAQ